MGIEYGQVNNYAKYGQPTLDLQFSGPKGSIRNRADGGAISVEFTRTQDTQASYVKSDGTIGYASTDVARFDHDPVTGESLGLLIEESRTNTWTYSEQPSQSPWTSTNITVTENNATSPDGNLTGALLSSSSSGDNYVYQTHIENIPTFTIYAKAGTTNNLWVRLQSDVVSRNVSYNFNLSNGTYSAATGNTGNLTGWTERKSITNVGNGWYRIEMGFTSTTNTVTTDYQISASTDGNASASGETVYIWGAQLEKNKTFPTSYIPTTGSTSTRGVDTASITGANFSTWYNGSEGSIFIDIKRPSSLSSGAYLEFYNNAGLFLSDIGTNFTVRIGAEGGAIALGDPTTTTDYKIASSYQSANDYKVSSNGSSVTSAITAVDFTTATELHIGRGNNAFTSNWRNGTGTCHFSRLTYWPTRLSDSDLQRLTE